MSTCCVVGRERRLPTWRRRAREFFAWVVPGTVFVLMPKCPACVAANLAVWTGLGVSLAAATYLRWGLLFVCVASLSLLIAVRIYRLINSNFVKGA